MEKGLRRLAAFGLAASMAVPTASTAMARVVPAMFVEAGSTKLPAPEEQPKPTEAKQKPQATPAATTASVEPAESTEAEAAESRVAETAVETEAPKEEVPTTDAGYVFRYGDVVVPMVVDASSILAVLGPASSMLEHESCAYQGRNKIYTYSGFELSTCPVGEKDYVESVYILDASVSASEGIRIGSTKQDVIAVYGSAYNADEAAFGTYAYTAGNTQLKVYTTNDVVDAIEYLVTPDE